MSSSRDKKLLSAEEYEKIKPHLSWFEEMPPVKHESDPRKEAEIVDQLEADLRRQAMKYAIAKEGSLSRGGFFSRLNPFASCLPPMVENIKKFKW